MINEQSISKLLNAERLIITCVLNQICPQGKPANICCLSCDEFQKCKNLCKSAEDWDVHLRKCKHGTGSEQ